MSNVVEILVTAKDLTGPAMAQVNAKVNSAGKGLAVMHKTALLAGAGFAAAGVEAVKMASKFDSEMALLNTQAGVSKDKVEGLKKGVLGLAGKVAQDPDSLAESLFHVESNFESMGITSKKALALTETAAKGATVGHANLVDVTNALTAAVASGIPGVQNFDQAMGILNATVGVGDMKMSDLAAAFGTGMVATVKGYGLSISDVSAGLAVFGDNNVRGAAAATQLRMTVQALAKPAAGGAAALQSIGLQTDTLAKDMQKGGLKLALEDLVNHMNAAGISSKQQGQIITEAFGKKAGTGLNTLVNQLDRLESKYPALAKGAMGFQDAWTATTHTFAYQMKSLQGSFDAFMISIGQKLIPPIQKFIGVLSDHKRATTDVTEAMLGLLGATVLVSAAMKTAAGAQILWSGVTKGAALATGAMETAALKSMYMKDAFVTAGGGARGLGASFGTLSTGAKLGISVGLITALGLAAKHFVDEAGAAKLTADQAASGFKALAAGAPAADTIEKISKALDAVNKNPGGGLVKDNSVLGLILGGSAKSSGEKTLKAAGSALADLVKNGDSNIAAAALERMTKAGVKLPKKDLDAYTHALADNEYQSELTAQSEGKFGEQAQQVQAQLDVQAASAKGLMDSLQALDKVNQDAFNGETKLYDAIAAGADIAKKKKASLDINTDAGRRARDAMSDIAAATDSETAALAKQSSSWDKVNSTYAKGYNALVADAMQMGKNKDQAKAYADSLLDIPKEVHLKGDIGDLEAKLKTAKSRLNSVPKSKKAALQASISDLEAKVLRAKWDLAQLGDKSITITTFMKSVYSGPQLGGAKRAGGGPVFGPGSGTSDDVPIMASNGEFVVNAQAAAKHRGLLESINSGMEGYAKGGKVTKAQKAAAERAKAAKQAAADRAKAEHDAAAEAMGSLNVSYFGRAIGGTHTGFANAMSSGAGGVGDLAQTLSQWQGQIKAATHGALESKLVAAFDKFGKAALKNEAALVAVNSKLSAAKDKLSSLKDSFAQLRDSVASSVSSYGSIAKGNTGQPGGAKSVISQLQTDTATAKRFAADLATLKKKGLNSQSLSELANAGIEGGGLENAERLLGSSKGDISEINSLEKALIAAGKAAGTTTADSMYGAGIKQAQGIVNGLAKQQANLNRIMAKAADAMAAQLKKALGGKASGGTVGAAATGGNRWGRTLVGEYQPEIVDLPIGSRVHSGPDTQQMLSGGGSGWGGQPIVIQQTIMLDGKVLANVMLDPQRELVRQLGGNVQKVYGQR